MAVDVFWHMESKGRWCSACQLLPDARNLLQCQPYLPWSNSCNPPSHHTDTTNTPPSPSKECAHMLPSLPDLLVPTRAHFNTDLSLILWTNTWL